MQARTIISICSVVVRLCLLLATVLPILAQADSVPVDAVKHGGWLDNLREKPRANVASSDEPFPPLEIGRAHV